MADVEVEETLREIRERVLAASEARADSRATAPAGAPSGADGAQTQAPSGDAEGPLARMGANLSTTGRAWSRLPPVLTYRRGAAARFELWLKRLIKRAAHWFTWEQVNFNSAAHQALSDARDALEAHALALEALREEVASCAERVSELNARVAAAESRLESELGGLRGALASYTGELRDRADAALEEQRVCFRQLSLEASELAVAHDRARRQLESRVEALEKTFESEE